MCNPVAYRSTAQSVSWHTSRVRRVGSSVSLNFAARKNKSKCVPSKMEEGIFEQMTRRLGELGQLFMSRRLAIRPRFVDDTHLTFSQSNTNNTNTTRNNYWPQHSDNHRTSSTTRDPRINRRAILWGNKPAANVNVNHENPPTLHHIVLAAAQAAAAATAATATATAREPTFTDGMTSYLTRRQQHHASHTNPHTLEPFSAALIPNHERGSLLQTPPGGRNRRRGSPFAALSEAYKPARATVFSGPGGRDRGEVLGLRSSSFGISWLKSSAEQRLPTATRSRRNLHQRLSSEVRITTKPVLLLPGRKKTDENAVLGRWMSSSSSSPSSASSSPIPEPSAKFTKKMAAAEAAAKEAAARKAEAAAAAGTGTAPPSPRRHRKSVSWPQGSVIRSIHQLPTTAATQSDVYSPDLQALEIARRLAISTRDPELRRAASAVDTCRRHAAQVVRTLTSEQNGGLEGVEEACRLYNWREAAFLRETDELVRRIVVGAGQERVWRLKASFRAARRRMQDADSA